MTTWPTISLLDDVKKICWSTIIIVMSIVSSSEIVQSIPCLLPFTSFFYKALCKKVLLGWNPTNLWYAWPGSGIWNLFEVSSSSYHCSIRVLLVWWLFFRWCLVLHWRLHLGSILWLFGERKKGTRISLVALPASSWFGCLGCMLLYQPKKKVCWLHCVVTGRLIWALIILLLNEIPCCATRRLSCLMLPYMAPAGFAIVSS
jgi:hypothetical protein